MLRKLALTANLAPTSQGRIKATAKAASGAVAGAVAVAVVASKVISRSKANRDSSKVART